jgi:hypothetical protein
MKQLISRWKLLAGILVVLGSSFWVWAQDGPRREPVAKASENIAVSTFHDRMPIGYLEKPLGTVVRINGECVDGDTLRLKMYASKKILRIDTVDGRKLPEPVDFIFRHDGDNIPVPKPGQRFDYSVHEYGSFDGIVRVPREHRDDENVVGLAAPGFGYRSHLEIHKSHPVK